MALVSYSDSEGSGDEAPAKAPAPVAKPAFQRTEPRKIKVDLPAPKVEKGSASTDEQPPAKRAKTAGSFGGFNSLLPAPKRAAPPKASLGKGVSLRTSSEAAFSRNPAPVLREEATKDDFESTTQTPSKPVGDEDAPKAEVKVMGKATRFKPLSVANSKRKATKKPVIPPMDEPKPQTVLGTSPTETTPVKKEKKSLFSLQQDEPEVPVEEDETDLQPIEADVEFSHNPAPPQPTSTATAGVPANSLEAVASDMNLTAAQRRQLFGRQGKNAAVKVTNFSLDSEYASNEQMRQAGETVEHRAVKTIAPGKHSLQQLVNNARSNQDSIEDKWAEGRRNRGEGGSKYGWGK